MTEPRDPGALSFDALRRANVERTTESFDLIDAWSPTDWATAVAGEVGEACNLIKKLRRLGHYPTFDLNAPPTTPAQEEIITAIGKELADAVTYLDLLAARLGLSLADCVRAKFNEVSDRVGSDVRLP